MTTLIKKNFVKPKFLFIEATTGEIYLSDDFNKKRLEEFMQGTLIAIDIELGAQLNEDGEWEELDIQ